jgi:uncharacterized membrane protein YbhN (UPF0104 family)
MPLSKTGPEAALLAHRPAGTPAADDRAEAPPRLGRALARTLATLALFLLACGVALWLARDSDAAAAAALLSPATVLACLALSFCNYLLRGLRWVVLGRAFGVAAPAGRQLLYFFAGFALTVTPGKVGEVVRLWLLHRHHGVPYTRSMPLLAGDRVLDMVAICLLALAGAALTSRYLAVTAVLALACCLLLGALSHAGLLLRLLDWTERRVRRAPGLFARVRVAGTGTYPAALIDDRAVGTDQDRRFVLVVGPDGAAQYRGVRLGPMSDGLRVVREGLKPGETIVVEGLQRVRPGMKVQPTAVPMDPKERPKPDPAAKK